LVRDAQNVIHAADVHTNAKANVKQHVIHAADVHAYAKANALMCVRSMV